MSGKEKPEQTAIVKKAMEEMAQNKAPGQPGVPQTTKMPPSETAKKMAKASPETLKKLGKAAS